MKRWSLPNEEGFITLEFTNHCNLNCVMCSTGGIPAKERHHMDFSLYKRIINTLADSSFKAGTLVPFWLGEPLMHPKFFEMIEYAAKRLTINVEIHTNATFLTPRLSKQLLGLDTSIRRIVFSIDAVKESTYNMIRRGGDFNTILSNIKEFLRQRRALGRHRPMLVFQFIVMRQNVKEKEEFIKFWQAVLRGFNSKPEIVYSEQDYPSQGDCIFIRRLDTSSLYQEDARSVYALTTRASEQEVSEYFNLIIPYFRVRSKIPTEVYETICKIPTELVERCKSFLDLNMPNTDYSKQILAGFIDGNTRLNLGFSSEKNFDNILDVFTAIKQIDPFVKNVLVFEGKHPPDSVVVDKTIPLEQFEWTTVNKQLSKEYSALKPSVNSVLLIMPKVYFKGDYNALRQAMGSYLELGSCLPMCISIDLNTNTVSQSQLLKKCKQVDIVIIFNKGLITNAVELGRVISSYGIKVFYWNEYSEKSYFLYPELRHIKRDSRRLSLLVASPPLYNLKQTPVDKLAHEASIIKAFESKCSVHYYNANLSGGLSAGLKGMSPSTIIVPNYKGVDSDTFGFVEALKRLAPSARIVVEEHSKLRVKPTSYKRNIDLVVYNIDWSSASVPDLILYGVSSASQVWPLGMRRYKLQVFSIKHKTCKIIYGKKPTEVTSDIGAVFKRLRLDWPSHPNILFVIPKLFSASAKELIAAHSVYRAIKTSLECDYLDMNLSGFDLPRSCNVVVVSNFKVLNNAFDLINEIKSVNPGVKVVVLEYDKHRMRETASKPLVDFVVHKGIDFQRFCNHLGKPGMLLLPGTAYRYGKNVLVNSIARKQLEMVKPPLDEQYANHRRVLVLGPELYAINKFPFKELEVESAICHALDCDYLNANNSSFNSVIDLIKRESIDTIVVPHHSIPNNAFELTKRIKERFPEIQTVVYEPDEREIKASVLKEGVDIVVHNINQKGLLKVLGNTELIARFFLSDIAFKYGDNVIINPPSARKKVSHDVALSRVGFGRPKTAVLIIPKFYGAPPSGVYMVAKELYTQGLNYYDTNFYHPAFGDLSIGIWVEGYPSNLIDILKKAKKGGKKTLVVFVGKGNAKGIFSNPAVDFLVYYNKATKGIVNAVLNGRWDPQLLAKMVYKFGSNIINKGINPGRVVPFGRPLNLVEAFQATKGVNFSTVRIDPLNWHSSEWDHYGPRIWEGDDQYAEGLSSLFGIYSGYFEYRFEAPSSELLEIHAKVCSHSHREEKRPGNGSELTLEINGKEIETRLVYFEPNRSNFVETWMFKGIRVKPKGNSLVFKVKRTAKHKNGLTIYGKTLKPRYKHIELPILLCFKK